MVGLERRSGERETASDRRRVSFGPAESIRLLSAAPCHARLDRLSARLAWRWPASSFERGAAGGRDGVVFLEKAHVMHTYQEFKGAYLLTSSVTIDLERTFDLGTRVHIVLHVNSERRSSQNLTIRFIDCVDMRLLNVACANAFLLDMRDISDWQNEGVRFLVRDIEEEVFNFKCREIAVETAEIFSQP